MIRWQRRRYDMVENKTAGSWCRCDELDDRPTDEANGPMEVGKRSVIDIYRIWKKKGLLFSEMEIRKKFIWRTLHMHLFNYLLKCIFAYVHMCVSVSVCVYMCVCVCVNECEPSLPFFFVCDLIIKFVYRRELYIWSVLQPGILSRF